ncbi:flagellar hook assembly protein FlgD [Reinekea blandensis]|uniref:Basal-body rod modification protein FlgD n=1 Tax=Reinekea blandensis MED297 TaxID=314283 RepID=A4BEL4_9GAMM|nr:flagellar hook assembly protein FlgD [Reinekea blandensis]EAR09441.1 Flagellar hook capping protein [Reinekea sp. MED297] [Reinekea blandensis MED297]
MTDVNNVNSALGQYDIGNKKKEETSNDELGKTEFLELMIAKLNNQDPLKPQDDAQFIAELAQFSTVEGIQNMSAGFEELATSYKSSQALQASSLVGGAVTIDGNTSSKLRHGELVYGSAEIPSGSDNLFLQIEDSTGQIIEDVPLGYQPNGELTFKWDGANLEVNGELADIDYSKFETDENGNIIPHPAGDYTFRIQGSVVGQAQVMDVSMSDRVDSVTILGNNDIQLNLASGETATMADVKQINAVY